ncbi:hypothetical protein JOD54_001095 [Actinokineospora baliensis]|uniref:peptidoglycan-binding domain-containing protein n=1 Tax=Actinokineospora baliensis TaxID=547056 RepID=UPI00195EE997|nr:peptidoglycan-binding protein [Actinokineospora baliensis]MBM7770891.1 hypothetical protein [Actinokineospora baliensis]
MSWRVARSLEALLAQLNSRAPHRSKISDGSIGDAAHASRSSDHNPWYVLNRQALVTARDFTHDVAGGLDGQWLADRLIASGDRRIKYIIWSRRIWTPGVGWRAYTGTNPHTRHVHLSVVASPACDDPAAWNLGGSPSPIPGGRPTLKRGSTGADVQLVQRFLGLRPVDGIYGPATETAVKRYQLAQRLTADGVVGPATWTRILSGLGGQPGVPGAGGTAPAPDSSPGRPTLRKGSTGEAVKLAQRWFGLNQDGVFGPDTEAKVVAYQRMKGLVPDGVIGARTWSAMGL